jgi:hypothetical protein
VGGTVGFVLSVDREGKFMAIGIVRRWGSAAVLGMLGTLCLASARGELVYFQVAELPGHETHHDSFILPLSDSDDIAHARDLISLGPEKAGGTIAFADIDPGADGINRDLLAADQHLWAWHVTRFEGFSDTGIELLDGWPSFVEQDVAGWIQNTGGKIGFWNYTVVSELPAVPEPRPEPIPFHIPLAGCFAMLGAVVWLATFQRRSRRAV